MTPQTKKKRERKASAQRAVAMATQHEPGLGHDLPDAPISHIEEKQEVDHLPEPSGAENKELLPISSFLHNVLVHDRIMLARLARDLDVSEQMIYRWMNGTSMPQPVYLKRLPNALPEHRHKLMHILRQTLPGLLEQDDLSSYEIPKTIYQRIVDVVATNDEHDLCLWQAIQASFIHLLLQLDPERHGMAVTYAKLSAKREDGMIHSLRELEMRGHAPWPPQTEFARAFLGSASLAGRVAIYQRWQAWNGELEGRIPVQIDRFERSACAAPLLRGRSIAGVLIVSSIYPLFFCDTRKCEMINEYARLLAIAVPPDDFQSIYHLRLQLMPELEVQRTRLNGVYNELVCKYVTLHNIQRSEAERWAEQDMEKEFETQPSQKAL